MIRRRNIEYRSPLIGKFEFSPTVFHLNFAVKFSHEKISVKTSKLSVTSIVLEDSIAQDYERFSKILERFLESLNFEIK